MKYEKKWVKKKIKKKVKKLVEKSISKSLFILVIWKYLQDIVYKKKFINWADIHLSWLFLKTNVELDFSIKYFISFSLSYLDEEEIEHTSHENEEGSDLILPYSLESSPISFSFLVSSNWVSRVTSLVTECIKSNFSLVQRMFFKLEMLYQYWSYLLRKTVQTKVINLFSNTLDVKRSPNKYRERLIRSSGQVRVTLFFYNFNKAFFKKFLSLRQLLWGMHTKQTRTKRRYKKFCSFRLKKQITIGNHQFLFYILRQLELVYSWEHLTLLLYYNLIKLNQQNISVGIQLQQGDILECYFGLLVDSYQESIFYLTEKYKFWVEHKFYYDNSSTLKLSPTQAQIPQFRKKLPYIQTGSTVGYTVDYTLNIILLTYIPVYTNLSSTVYYYNLSLFPLSVWRYNI